jgi:2-hydroxy fatty acid dioxygenase
MYFPFLYMMYGSAVKLVVADQSQSSKSPSWTGSNVPLALAGIVQFLSWYVQIKVGHQMIEGAQPAVMQSVGGALSTAPLFAFYEALWCIGLRKSFQQEILQQVSIYTKQLCESGIKMTACSTL